MFSIIGAIAEAIKDEENYQVVPITRFYAFCECPQCNTWDTHMFEYITISYITRICNNVNCNRKWKQER